MGFIIIILAVHFIKRDVSLRLFTEIIEVNSCNEEILIIIFSAAWLSVFNTYSTIDDSAKGCLTQFWELFTMIPCAPKHLNR